MRIIPAIDIINGQCVRLSQGDYARKKIYSESPLEVAKQFEDVGIQYLHLVDLDGAKKGSVVNDKTIEAICTQTKLQVDFGGGVKTDEDIEKVFKLGVQQVTAGSLAIENPDKVKTWMQCHGADKIIIGADVNKRKIAINGWKKTTEKSIDELIQDFSKHGLKEIICTDIATDGMLKGPPLKLYAYLRKTYPQLNVIASGGVASIKDVEELEKIGIQAVIVGKALYENKISLKELQAYVD